MKTIVSSVPKNQAKLASRYLSQCAKDTLLNRLKKIEIGCLIIEDDGDVYRFGRADSNPHLHARVHVLDTACYLRILLGGATGAGEAYMQNMWSSPDLVKVVQVIVANQRVLSNMDSCWSWLTKFCESTAQVFRLNTKKGSRNNISAHYDLSNEFFSLFLDRSMMYSAAIFPDSTVNLSEASLIKLEHVCRRLNLSAQDHLLEIGAGWGGMAIYAARHYGCRVTTTTISRKQYNVACDRVREAGLEEKVEVLLKDYRDLDGQYDKLVSIEMVEAVGHQFYSKFFSACSNLLKPDGMMLMQAITAQDRRFKKEKNKSDFIRKYIFPGGCLPSNHIIMENLSQYTDFHLVGLEDITFDYAKTLAAWRLSFMDKLNEVKCLGFDDVFIRMWEFYLAYCEGGFRERVINTSQFLFAKPRCKDLPNLSASQYNELF